MEKIYKPENGIYGYAPPAPSGSRGKDGNDMFYSPIKLDKNVNIAITKSLITHNRTLSLIPYVQNTGETRYSDGDLIVTMDGSVYIMNDIEENIRIDRVGSIKIPVIDPYEGNSPLGGQGDIIFEVQSTSYSDTNDYNYVEGCLSPLYHHRDSVDSSVYGNYIQCTSSLDKVIPLLDGQYLKLVINFISGMRYEKILTAKDYANPIFIDNRYLLNYGHTETNAYTLSSIQSYAAESSPNTAITLQPNLINDGKVCMADGYLEYSYQSRTYRQKILIQMPS